MPMYFGFFQICNILLLFTVFKNCLIISIRTRIPRMQLQTYMYEMCRNLYVCKSLIAFVQYSYFCCYVWMTYVLRCRIRWHNFALGNINLSGFVTFPSLNLFWKLIWPLLFKAHVLWQTCSKVGSFLLLNICCSSLGSFSCFVVLLICNLAQACIGFQLLHLIIFCEAVCA